MNKIISMSVWGDSPRYIIGAKRQVELAKKYYPDWKVKIYVDNLEHFNDIDDICELILIKDNSYGVFWRFFPMFESPDNITMVRDADGRITVREHLCINEWLNSDTTFHTFRDHEAHFEFPIIACAFAYKGILPNTIFNIMYNYMNGNKFYLSDQFFLRDHVFPVVKTDCLIHSMFDTGWFSETRKKLKNKFCFCGNGFDEFDIPLYPDSLNYLGNFNIDKINYKFDEGILNE